MNWDIASTFIVRLYKMFLEHGATKVVLSALASLFALPTTVIVVVLMIIDYVTGVYKAYINHEITSAMFRQGIAKIAIYLVAIISVGFTAQVNPVLGFLNSFIAMSIAVTELTSILENLLIICRKLNIPSPILQALARVLRVDQEAIFNNSVKGKLPFNIQINIGSDEKADGSTEAK